MALVLLTELVAKAVSVTVRFGHDVESRRRCGKLESPSLFNVIKEAQLRNFGKAGLRCL